jgi:hypothetical protein
MLQRDDQQEQEHFSLWSVLLLETSWFISKLDARVAKTPELVA